MTRLGLRSALVTLLLLSIPAIGMQVSRDWNWGPGDFLFFGALIFGTGFTFELFVRRHRDRAYRVGLALSLLTSLVLVYVNLAVGMLGDGDHDPVNAVYFGLVALGATGAFVARFEPGGMFRAALVVVAAQALVTITALALGLHGAPTGPAKTTAANLVVLALYASAAACFRLSARRSLPA
jgi:hypothetical protein